MSFISAYHDRRSDKVVVWERTESGKRIRVEHAPLYNFYVPDPNGTFTAITGEKLKFVSFGSKKEFEDGCLSYSKRFESDITPLEKVMMTYFGKPAPKLSIGFVDIEVDYDPILGFARPSNPYAPINSLTLYRSNNNKYYTIAIPPKGFIGNLPQEMIDDNYILVKSEHELLERFLNLQEECDIVSGWNSEFFDVPYIGKRIELLFGQQALKRLAFESGPSPRWGEKDRFKGSKEKELVLDLGSRVHLDYMALFKKFTLGGRQSFSLAAISEEEIDMPKLHYDGSLHELYNGTYRPNLDAVKPEEDQDELYILNLTREQIRQVLESDEISDADKECFTEQYVELDSKIKRESFFKFITYNRRDVSCIVDIDKKFNYVSLANEMVHMATVNFSAIFGSVQLIDSAIINICHHELNKIVFDKSHKQSKKVEGAVVMSPKVGLHKMVGSCDLNSLYPSTYRSLNLSPEMIIGQLAEYEEGWRYIYEARVDPTNQDLLNRVVTIIPEGAPDYGTLDSEGNVIESGLEMKVGDFIRFIEENKYAVSAYGTILDQSRGEGLLPYVLTSWFKGRKELQAKKKEYVKKSDEYLENGGNKTDQEYIELSSNADYYDMLQGVRKVLLNSTYGATLNEFCRFGDPRLGASTTGSGRQITTHMCNTISSCLIGENAPKLVKTITTESDGEIENTYTMDVPDGLGPIYSDTDSCYFVMDKLVNGDLDLAVNLADEIVGIVNESFVPFMKLAFNCQPNFDTLIKAAREVVAVTGIFSAKKKYMLLVANMEGRPLSLDDPKSLKTQGSDIKISSTPEIIRELLKDVTLSILKGESKDSIDDKIIEFRKKLDGTQEINPLDFATITSVKNLESYWVKYSATELAGFGSVNLPSNVRATFNHNACIKAFEDHDTPEIKSGQKIKIIWLRPNDYDFKNMSFNSDTETLPKWFIDNFEVDIKLTEQKLVDQKISNIFKPIGWEVPTAHTQVVKKLIVF